MARRFEDIIGQETVKNVLLSSLRQNKVSHAYILEGDAGMGKKLMAYTFADYLVCSEKTSCGICQDCVLAEAGTHPDIITVHPAEGKKSIGVEEIRRVVGEASVKPYMAAKKVILIPDCDTLTPSSQNALLKVLEEPPEYIVFLLLVQNSNYLLETVRSRSIKLTLQPYTAEEMIQGVRGRSVQPQAGLSHILAYAGNNIGKAIELSEDEEFAELRDKVLRAMPSLFTDNHYKMYEMVRLFEEQKNNAAVLLDCMLSVFRDLILMKNGCEKLLQNTDFEDQLTGLEQKAQMGSCVALAGDIVKTKEMLSRNVNYNLLVTALINGCWEVLHGRDSRSVF